MISSPMLHFSKVRCYKFSKLWSSEKHLGDRCSFWDRLRDFKVCGVLFMIVMKESSVNMVSIRDILCSICKFITAVAMEGATRGLTMKESRQYLRPLPMPLGV